MKWFIRTAVVVVWLISLVYVFGAGALVGTFAPQLAEWPMARAMQLISFFTGSCALTPTPIYGTLPRSNNA